MPPVIRTRSLIADMNLFKSAVASDAPVSEIEKYTSTMFYAPNVSWIAMRSGMDKQHDLDGFYQCQPGNHASMPMASPRALWQGLCAGT